MKNPQPKQTEDIDVARVQFFRSVERLLADAEQAKKDRDRLLLLLERPKGEPCK